jgi:CubicO group peptidase (beta-lactamase class C family)
MRINRILILVLIIATAIVTCSKEPTKPEGIVTGDYTYTIDYLTYQIEKEIEEENIPAISVAILDEGGPIWSNGFGVTDREENTPVSKESIFKAGSMAGLFVQTAIMKLYQEGKLDIDAPLKQYLPEFSINSRYDTTENDITLRHIMNYRSGLPRDIYFQAGFTMEDEKKPTYDELLRKLSKQYLAFPIDYKFNESQIGLNLLGIVIEKVTGEDFAQYMEEEVFLPLGMKNTTYQFKPEMADRLVNGYYEVDGEQVEVTQTDFHDLPANNVYITLEDMSRFAVAMLRVYSDNEESQTVISKDTLDMMLKDEYSTPQDPRKTGLGWLLGEDEKRGTTAYYMGSLTGYASYIGIKPEKGLGFVMLSNGFMMASSGSIASNTFRNAIEAKYGIKNEDEKKKEYTYIDYKQIDTSLLERYTGKFNMGGMGGRIYKKNGKLEFRMENTESIPIPIIFNLNPIDKRTFIPRNSIMDFFGMSDRFELTFKYFLEEHLTVKRGINQSDSVVGEEFVQSNMMNVMFVNMYKLNPPEEIPDYWKNFIGSYEMMLGDELMARVELEIEDNILMMKVVEFIHPVFNGAPSMSPTVTIPLNPVNENELTFIGGMMSMYDGETLFYDSVTGQIHFLDMKLVPVSDD